MSEFKRRGFLVTSMLGILLACSSTDDGPRTLIAASNMTHPPFSSWDADGSAVGVEVEIVEAAARELGAEVRWIERPFPELLDAVAKGEIDVAVSTIGITDARKQRVAFSNPYYETQIVALVGKDAPSATSLAELARSRIGADEATTSYTAAGKQWPSATLIGRVTEGMDWPRMVEEKLIDAFVVDASDQQRLESASGVSLHRIEQPLSAEYFGVAMARGAVELQAAVNRAIANRAPELESPGSDSGPPAAQGSGPPR